MEPWPEPNTPAGVLGEVAKATSLHPRVRVAIGPYIGLTIAQIYRIDICMGYIDRHTRENRAAKCVHAWNPWSLHSLGSWRRDHSMAKSFASEW